MIADTDLMNRFTLSQSELPIKESACPHCYKASKLLISMIAKKSQCGVWKAG